MRTKNRGHLAVPGNQVLAAAGLFWVRWARFITEEANRGAWPCACDACDTGHCNRLLRKRLRKIAEVDDATRVSSMRRGPA